MIVAEIINKVREMNLKGLSIYVGVAGEIIPYDDYYECFVVEDYSLTRDVPVKDGQSGEKSFLLIILKNLIEFHTTGMDLPVTILDDKERGIRVDFYEILGWEDGRYDVGLNAKLSVQKPEDSEYRMILKHSTVYHKEDIKEFTPLGGEREVVFMRELGGGIFPTGWKCVVVDSEMEELFFEPFKYRWPFPIENRFWIEVMDKNRNIVCCSKVVYSFIEFKHNTIAIKVE